MQAAEEFISVLSGNGFFAVGNVLQHPIWIEEENRSVVLVLLTDLVVDDKYLACTRGSLGEVIKDSLILEVDQLRRRAQQFEYIGLRCDPCLKLINRNLTSEVTDPVDRAIVRASADCQCEGSDSNFQ